MKILVANDDGVFHPGLWALVRAAQPLGDVVVSAPDRNRSGIGAAMTLHDPVRVREAPALIPGVPAFAVEGTPADAVVVGLRELADGPVDMVLAGINPGNNASTNVLVSGTVGAAYAGHLNGVASMAVSVGYEVDVDDASVNAITRAAASALLEHSTNEGALVNLNFPWRQDFPLKGCRITKPAPRIYEDHTRPGEEAGHSFYWLYRELAPDADLDALPDDTDVGALRQGFVSISSLGWQTDGAGEDNLLRRIKQAVEDAI